MPTLLMSGNQAVAEAARLARVGVVAAYPITPQTTIVERIAEMIGAREMDAEYITVESEHSAMAASIGASLAGARAFTATSSQGLALMHELLHWAAGQRAPIVMANVNRALAPPWNVWVDHTDSMAQRDTGWLQLYAADDQEALDATLLAFRVAEEVSLPMMVMLDGFVLSHTYMPVDVPTQAQADAVLPPFAPAQRIEPGKTQLFGSFSPPDLAYMEFRHDIHDAQLRARGALLNAERAWHDITGRLPRGLIEEYATEDADVVLVAAGSLASTAREAVDVVRAEGGKAGLARLRVFRPFPDEELRDLAARVPRLGVVDRAFSFGSAGALVSETRAALHGRHSGQEVAGFVAGLGGRNVDAPQLAKLLRRMLSGESPREEWVGLKEVA